MVRHGVVADTVGMDFDEHETVVFDPVGELRAVDYPAFAVCDSNGIEFLQVLRNAVVLFYAIDDRWA